MTGPDSKHERVVAISGAGTGIGRVATTKFAALGWKVAVGGRRAERLAETKAIVEEAGGTCLAHELDVSDGESVDKFFSGSTRHSSRGLLVISPNPLSRSRAHRDHIPAVTAVESPRAPCCTASMFWWPGS